MKILGYSERGIINSLIFSIVESNDNDLMHQFIELMGISLDKPDDYEILLEQSFSDFGDPDLIIILKYELHKKVIFIEGKVKTSKPSSWSLSNQHKEYLEDKNSSNLFFQLYQKLNLFDNKDDILTNRERSIPSKIRDRKIGENPIVWKAFKKIAECDKAFYVGLIPSSKQQNDKFNEKLDYKIHLLSWAEVYGFCQKHKSELQNVIDVFEFNDGQIY